MILNSNVYIDLIKAKDNLEISLAQEDTYFVMEDLVIFKENLNIFINNNDVEFYDYKFKEIVKDIISLERDAEEFLRDQIK